MVVEEKDVAEVNVVVVIVDLGEVILRVVDSTVVIGIE